jgi:tetratricopeptide (TPR) repeat protein
MSQSGRTQQPRHLRQIQARLAEIESLSRGPGLRQAIAMATAMSAEGVENPGLLSLMAHGAQLEGRFDEGVEYVKRALRLVPDEPSLLTTLGNLLSQAGRHHDAEAVYRHAVERDRGNLTSLQGLAQTYLNLGDYVSAEAQYRSALAVNPRWPDALSGLALIAQRRGDPQVATSLARRALEGDPAHSGALLVLTQIAAMDGDFAQAEVYARAALRSPSIDGPDRATALTRLADALHAQARYGEAMDAYREAKSLLHAYYQREYVRPGVETPGVRTRRLADALANADPAPWRSEPPDDDAKSSRLAFLVGFPRSGTTLLEQILDSHDDVVTLEEQPTLTESEEAFLLAPDGLARLATISPDEAEVFRTAYWRRVESLAPDCRGKLILDKMPLNTVALPIIAKLFPHARILFAIRDPRDVVLSCFRQAFGMNPSMYEFTTLEGAAGFYDSVMRLAERALEILPLSTFVARHEALVTDFDVQAQAICAHIGLTWDPAMRDFATKTANKIIRTPSARQVRKGLNSSGFAQWRHYEAELGPVLPVLQRWVTHWGYEP